MQNYQQNSYNINAGSDFTPVHNGLHQLLRADASMDTTFLKKSAKVEVERLALTNGLGSNGHNSVNGKKFGASGSTGGQARHPMTNQLTYIKRTVYPSMHKHPYSWPFHEPVDVVKLNLPDYYRIIKRPMDMRTIKKKLDSQQYSSAKECIDDFTLMFNNCYTYNGEKEDVYQMCKTLEKSFREKIAKMPAEEIIVQPSSKKSKLTPPRPSSRLTPETATRRTVAVANGTTTATAVAVSSSTSDSVTTKPNDVSVNRLNEDAAAETSVQTPVLMKPSIVEAKLSTDVPPQNSAVVAPALSHSAKTKKGVKRKADTATSCSVTPASTSVYSSSLEPAGTPLSAPPVIGRQDVLRPVKRPKKELTETDSQLRVGAGTPQVSDVWKLCANIVRDLMSKKCQSFSYLFLHPVDPTFPEQANYYEVIKHPMDLSTVKRKLDAHEYATVDEFAKDVKLIISNCYLYNPPDSFPVKMARKLQDTFEARFARVVSVEAGSPVAIATGLAKVECQKKTESSDESSSEDDSDAIEREKQLAALQQQLAALQDQLAKLSAERPTKPEPKKKRTKTSQLAPVPDVISQLPSTTASQSVTVPVLSTDSVQSKPTPKPRPQPKPKSQAAAAVANTTPTVPKKPRQPRTPRTKKQPTPAAAVPVAAVSSASAPVMSPPMSTVVSSPPPPLLSASWSTSPMTYEEKRQLSLEINKLPGYFQLPS